ncbi:MAG: hypothetical protein LBB10_03775, partial [Bifidobacteriaceae bacterium]|nr:hypothetical protein [Bifidobacteriaceae bacterium]
AKMIAGVLYTDKGVITVSENLNPKSDFFYIDSDSNLPKGISPKSFRDDLDFEPLTYFDAVVKENDGSSKYKLIVFDNPTAGKSLIDKAAFWNDIKAFVKKNKNLIVAIVSSDFDEIDSLINRVVILKDNGEIVDQKAANFKKQKSLKERVINEITN